ncbi:cation-dependent mannose-6-phosphate receptor [Corythoichthys intestinalis]|uniref:cation-dependent mannose-6-phosphate receptor n=1 Tax=Corythoichthys intestinalis TaxID=161448 RepID=UPI0025A4E150|nr:cation-dependent mannose-6-phosphate receptor [Corythoichthys intestinalis]
MQVLTNSIGGSLLVWTLAIQLLPLGSGVHATNVTKNCKLNFESESERKDLQRIEPLGHRNFSAEFIIGDDKYTYVFQLCGDAGGVPGAGIIQVKAQKTEQSTEKSVTIIGLYNATEVIGGTDFVWLAYGNGEKYDNHCSQEQRKAFVMIFCNRNIDVSQLVVVQENRERKQNCFYLFKLESSAVCPPLEYKLSAGSIILIIGFCLVAVYLIVGFLYQRLIVGAKGMEQFPNYAFWVEVGNLSADGCDFVCRSRDRDDAPAYRGVSTEPLDEEPEERDDHLLPM